MPWSYLLLAAGVVVFLNVVLVLLLVVNAHVHRDDATSTNDDWSG